MATLRQKSFHSNWPQDDYIISLIFIYYLCLVRSQWSCKRYRMPIFCEYMGINEYSMVTEDGCSSCFIKNFPTKIIWRLSAKMTLTLRCILFTFRDYVVYSEVSYIVAFPSAGNTWASTGGKRTAQDWVFRDNIEFFFMFHLLITKLGSLLCQMRKINKRKFCKYACDVYFTQLRWASTFGRPIAPNF